MPKIYGELQVGKRSQGGQRETLKGYPKTSLKDQHTTGSWALSRSKRADDYEAKRICEAERKLQERRQR